MSTMYLGYKVCPHAHRKIGSFTFYLKSAPSDVHMDPVLPEKVDRTAVKVDRGSSSRSTCKLVDTLGLHHKNVGDHPCQMEGLPRVCSMGAQQTIRSWPPGRPWEEATDFLLPTALHTAGCPASGQLIKMVSVLQTWSFTGNGLMLLAHVSTIQGHDVNLENRCCASFEIAKNSYFLSFCELMKALWLIWTVKS